MGKRKKVEKLNEDEGKGESFSLSSASSAILINEKTTRASQPHFQKPNTKKSKMAVGEDESSNSQARRDQDQEGNQGGSFKTTSIQDLPTEMLTKILKSVNSRTLFICRFVNRKWNSISSGILQHRPESEISFEFEYGTFYTQLRNEGQKYPWDFLQFFKGAKSCPFARFYFWVNVTSKSSVPSPDFLDCEDFNEFLAHFKSEATTTTTTNTKTASTSIIKIPTKIKCLKLDFHFDYKNLHLLKTVTKKLRNLLLNKIPHLEEFGLNFSCKFKAPKVRFFPLQFQLPHLKILHLRHGMIQQFPGIFHDLLSAAVNLNKIQFNQSKILTAEEIKDLCSLEKRILVQNSVIKITNDFLSLIKQEEQEGDSPVPIWFSMIKFEEMVLDIRLVDHESTSLVQNLLESNKNTLIHLTMAPLGFEPPPPLDLQLPTFKNLKKLSFHQTGDRRSVQIFPVGVRPIQLENSDFDWTTAGIFPAVNSLDFLISDWDAGFPQKDSIPIFPLVQTLTISEIQLRRPGKSIPVISLMCPNLKHFHIQKTDSLRLEFLPLARLIWTHMSQLEILEIPVDIGLSSNNSTALDSCFTGFCLAECSRISEIIGAKETLEKWGIRTRIPKAKLTAERNHPSLLDMKDLKNLIINPYSDRRQLHRKEFTKTLTWISTEFAFKLMPHLKASKNKKKS